MTHREVALGLILKNEEVIRNRLLGDGYMFDDELGETYISSPVVRELPKYIEEYFKLEKEQYIIRDEINAKERSQGVFYFPECEIDFAEIKKIAKQHYKLK